MYNREYLWKKRFVLGDKLRFKKCQYQFFTCLRVCGRVPIKSYALSGKAYCLTRFEISRMLWYHRGFPSPYLKWRKRPQWKKIMFNRTARVHIKWKVCDIMKLLLSEVDVCLRHQSYGTNIAKCISCNAGIVQSKLHFPGNLYSLRQEIVEASEQK